MLSFRHIYHGGTWIHRWLKLSTRPSGGATVQDSKNIQYLCRSIFTSGSYVNSEYSSLYKEPLDKSEFGVIQSVFFMY
jgi:hypothetical protein